MAITHPTAVRNGIADYVVDLIDVSGPGTLEFRTAGSAEVATLTFANPAFGAASGGQAVANALVGDSDATGGTVSQFTVLDGAAAEVFSGTVSASGGGGDIILSSLDVGATDTVEIVSLSYTAPN